MQYVPGPEATINPIISQLGEAFAKFANPFAEMQMKTLAAVQQNPELLQHLADMEYSNPGVMQRMGLGNVGKFIGSVDPSLRAQYEKEYGPLELAAKGQAVKNEAEIGKETAKLLSESGTRTDIVRVANKLPTTAQQATDEAQAKSATAKAKNADLEQQAEAQRLQSYLKVMKKFPDLHTLKPEQLFEHMDQPGVAEAISALFGDESTKGMMQLAFQNYAMNSNAALRRELVGLRFQNNMYQDREAYQMWSKSNGVGSIQSWKAFMFPENQQGLSPNQVAELPKIQDYLNTKSSLNNFSAVMKLSTEIRSIGRELFTDKNLSDSDRARKVADLNVKLAERAKLTGEDLIEAKIENKHSVLGFGWGTAINFYQNGQQMEDDKAADAIKTPPLPVSDTTETVKPTSTTTVSKYDTDWKVQTAIADISRAPDKKKAWADVQRLMASDPAALAYIKRKVGL